MALQSIDETGNITWKCHSKQGCLHSKHISDEAIKWISPYEVELPRCNVCGEQCNLKVIYTEEELGVDSLIQKGMVPQQMTVPHAMTGEPVPVMIPVWMPIGPNPALVKHQKLAELLQQQGKMWQEPPTTTENNTNDGAPQPEESLGYQ